MFKTKLLWLMILPLLLLSLTFKSKSAHAYPKIEVTNNTPYNVRIKAMYPGCKSDTFTVKSGKMARPKANRGACLIKQIEGWIKGQKSKHGEKLTVTKYTSSGTAFVKFRIEAYGDRMKSSRNSLIKLPRSLQVKVQDLSSSIKLSGQLPSRLIK